MQEGSSISTFNIFADLFIMVFKSFSSYSSNLWTIPNLSLRGVVRDPAFVVAPINVNLGKFILIDFAVGPFPNIMSSLKSSIAGYRISSMFLFSLCISSINKTSFGLSAVSIAAKSPGFVIAGPVVILMLESISFAMMFASVVFPSPGGPYKST